MPYKTIKIYFAIAYVVLIIGFPLQCLSEDDISPETKKTEKIEYDGLERNFASLRKGSHAEDMRGTAANFLNDLAIFLIEEGEWYLSGPIIQNAKALCPPDSTALLNHISITEASFQYLDGQLDKAQTTYRRLYQTNGGDSIETDVNIRLAINLGEVAQQSGRKKEALQYFERAMDLADSIGSSFLFINAAIHAERLEDNTKVGAKTLMKCVEEAYQNNYLTLMAPAYLALARYHFRQNDYERASQELDKACAMARKLGQPHYEAEGLRLWSDIYLRQNNIAMANACLQRLCLQTEHAMLDSHEAIAQHINLIGEALAWTDGLIAGDTPKHPSIILHIILAICLAALVIAGYLLFFYRRKTSTVSEQLPQHPSEAQHQMLQARKEIDKLEILYKGYGAIMQRIRQALRNIKPEDQPSQNKIKELISSILVNTLPERTTPFTTEMLEADNDFIRHLEEKSGTALNPTDRKLAIYLLHGLSSQEISAITGILPKSVNQNRYRLRRVLGLEQDEDLEAYLMSVAEGEKTEIDNTTIDNQHINIHT